MDDSVIFFSNVIVDKNNIDEQRPVFFKPVAVIAGWTILTDVRDVMSP